MHITLIGFAAVAVFALLGYARGFFRIVGAVICFLVAGLLSSPLSGLGELVIRGFVHVPRALSPIAGRLTAGLLLYLIFQIAASRLLANHEVVREQRNKAPQAPWEKTTGAVIGALWGFSILMFTLTGLHAVGTVEEVLSPPVARKSGARADWDSATETVAYADAAGAPAEPQTPMSKLKMMIEGSIYGGLVQEVTPVDAGVQQTFDDLAYVVSEPDLFAALRNHPDIRPYLDDPRLQPLASDPTVQALLNSGDFYALLDNEKIADILQDRQLFEELRRIDLGGILQEVIEAE